MESTQTKTKDKQKTTEQMLIEQLPEDLQSFCTSGKSVADLAHLVKNIIQMVSGSVEIMELGLQRKQYDRVRRSWDIFEPNFIRLKKFVLDLIKYTKLYPLQKTTCDFNQIIQEGIGSCDYFLKKKHVKIQFHQDKTIPAVQLDPDRIEEIVVNLITHAFDNLSDPVGVITVQSHYVTESGQIQLVVSDDGPGISENMKQQLTEPFERTRNMVGTGFDIPLSMRYVQQHDGYMEIGSDEETGNYVSVYLPVQ